MSTFALTPEEQLKELKKGVVDFVSEEDLLEKLKKSYSDKKPLRIKAGFDPSRPDLHLGHTVLINKLKQFQDLGHQVIFLIGDFTAMIGDPTGKNETRPELSAEEVKQYAQTYSEQVFKILDSEKTEVAYNNTWFQQFSASDFIKLSSQYTMARMLERDDFSKRFHSNQSIAIHELLYPLVQAYDSVALKADVELGGTDQLFNLLVGRSIQKSYDMKEQCVITVPILEGLDGVQKMSKSYDNYIAIEDTPKDIFGKTMKISDELMIKYYELLTDLSVAELEELKKDLQSGRRHPREVKVNLAKQLVARFYSQSEAGKAEEEFNRIFVNKGLPDEIPVFEYDYESLHQKGLCALMTQIHLSQSNSEARRLIEGRAVEMSGEKITDPQFKVDLATISGDEFIIKAGKKKICKGDDQAMKVKFIPQNVEFDISPDQSVMELAHEKGLFIKSICNGMPSCAECRVRLVEGESNVLDPSAKELSLIGSAHFLDQRRLSCQLRCFGKVVVDLTEQVAKEENEKHRRPYSHSRKEEQEVSHAVSGNLIEQENTLIEKLSTVEPQPKKTFLKKRPTKKRTSQKRSRNQSKNRFRKKQ